MHKKKPNNSQNTYKHFYSSIFKCIKKPKEMSSENDSCLETVDCELSERTIVNKCFKKNSCVEKIAPLTHDGIKNSILREMKKAMGNLNILYDIANRKVETGDLEERLKSAKEKEVNVAFLWSAFCKQSKLLKELILLGANIRYFEPTHGLTALHLAAFSGCLDSARYLISLKANSNVVNKWYSPLHCAAIGKQVETAEILLDNGARLDSMTNGPGYETPLFIAVKANAVECVRLFMKRGAQIYQEGKLADMSPLFLAAELGHGECLKIILDTNGFNCNQFRKTKNGNTALHLAAEEGHTECLEALLKHGADPNLTNFRCQSALHLAVRANSYTSVVLLLKQSNANVNFEDINKRTPLHEAIELVADSRRDIVRVLLENDAEVNARDQHGLTPLHIAALNELPHCVSLLIKQGAVYSIKSNTGISAFALIAKKTPTALEAIKEKFSQHISLESKLGSALNEVEIKFDFRKGLHHPNEYVLLNAFIDSGHEEMLLIPFCTAFLYVTWCRIRRCYYGMIYNSLVFSLMLLMYVLTALAYDCDRQINASRSTNNNSTVHCNNTSYSFLLRSPLTVEMQWYILLYVTLSLAYRKTYGFRGYPSLKHYCLNWGNLLEWNCIIYVFAISFIYTGRVETWQVHAGGFAVLSAWTNVMFLVGQLPVFGPYVEMFQKVQSEFFKLLLVYFSLLFGYTISFCVFFPNSSAFANPLIGIVSILVMMTGDMNYNVMLDYDQDQSDLTMGRIGAQVVYTWFVLFITIILMNLLIGIAVHDIQGLQKTADLSRLVRQAKVSSYIELSHLNRSKLSKSIMTLLRVTPKPYIGMLKCKPLDPMENKLPKIILQAAYDEARKRDIFKRKVFSRTQSEKSPWKKVINSSIRKNHSEVKWATSLSQLSQKMDQNYVQAKNLHAEVNELKEIMKAYFLHLINKNNI